MRKNLNPKKTRHSVFKPMIAACAVLIVLFICLAALTGFLRDCDYFKIKDVIFSGNSSADLAYLRGTGIFSLNLEKESQYLLERYPAYSVVKLVRVLPNRIFVEFKKRKPIAFVKLNRYYCLDEQAVLFDVPQDAQEADLPLILGFESRIFGPSPGSRYNIAELMLALNIIKEAGLNAALRGFKIKVINVANGNSASFFLSLPDASQTEQPASAAQGLEVKLGPTDIKFKIGILAGLLGQSANELSNIKYIDLRFKEPVIKFKEDKG
jgi:cell division septal protein FtsQ